MATSAMVPAGPGTAQANDGLSAQLEALIRDAALGDGLGVAVADTLTGRQLFAHQASKPRNPASNMKLVTAAAALVELGAQFQMRSGLYGRVEGHAVQGGLYLKGYGDPALDFAGVIALARELAAQGVRSVDRIVVDGSYFDERVLPPAFEQQPDEIAAFRAPIAAVSVDRGAYVLRVRPGDAVGKPARVQLDGAGYFALDNALTTTEGGAPSVVAIQRPQGDQLALLLRGGVPTGIRMLSYRRRVEDPLLHAGHLLADALKMVGIRGAPAVTRGRVPGGVGLLTSRTSPPVGSLIAAMGKDSDNYTAEMLLKVMGAEKAGQPGTSQAGARVAEALLERSGTPSGKAKIVNGSGLFNGNLLAPDHLTKLLVFMYRDPAYRADFTQHLAVGGVDGTLSRRLGDLPPRIVRAKTGTLNDVIALSGYVLGPEPSRAYAFSFLANGVRGKHYAARKLADDIVRVLAAQLHPTS